MIQHPLFAMLGNCWMGNIQCVEIGLSPSWRISESTHSKGGFGFLIWHFFLVLPSFCFVFQITAFLTQKMAQQMLVFIGT